MERTGQSAVFDSNWKRGGFAMMKSIASFVFGIALIGIVAWKFGGSFMIIEHPSPFGVEETAARIQANIQALEGHGWKLSGLRDPSKAVANAGRNVPPVLLVEACSTKYSAPLLADDRTRMLSILMPCTITVFKKEDGKTYVGTMNAGLMGHLFGAKVASIMSEVAKDQKKFLTFDPDTPPPPLIKVRPGGGGKEGEETSGC
jgi:uncharacterized protein (DUF302 family)